MYYKMHIKVITEKYVGNITEMTSFYKWFYKISHLVAISTFPTVSYKEMIKNNEKITIYFIFINKNLCWFVNGFWIRHIYTYVEIYIQQPAT